ncbi:amidohydrolase family protein [Paracandidimonas soli]|uniref:Putative TIM-barrel fold metal-dependent hydrolase n=1 Tax=Paracandidimonas soli TaxID=1917182 RepID=A0A4R3V484_9BURK|nr:amidohydrolase family protein [Paracandidimonas soli]TCU98331.1 putative TIM-barrel fold metal-dependent hydrolase [Paracandidimonas soli]
MTGISAAANKQESGSAFAQACDCHTHVFGPEAQYPFAQRRTYTPGEASVAQLEALHGRLGIGRTVIVQPSPYGTDNRCTLDAVRSLNRDGADRARAVVVIDGQAGRGELESLHDAGARGVRINLETFGVMDTGLARERLLHVAGQVAPLGWHIQVYTNPIVIAGLSGVFQDLPAPVVFDHFAGMRPELGMDQPGMAELMQLMRSGKAYVKLSAAHRVTGEAGYGAVAGMVRAWAALRPDRLLWGSDWPHPGAWPGVARSPDRIEPFHPIDDEAALSALAGWLPDASMRAAVLAHNPARLYGWQASDAA